MNGMMSKLLTVGALAASLGLASAAQAATVYCPSADGDGLAAPTSGRYVEVTNAASPGACFYTEGNLDVQNGKPYKDAGYTLLEKNVIGENGNTGGKLLTTVFTGAVTSGSWDLAANIWDTYDNLHLGFHFGQGGGDPDSFIVELAFGQLSGLWAFLAIAPDKVNGISNFYLFSKGPKPPNGVPEPSTLALLGLGLVGFGVARRRLAR